MATMPRCRAEINKVIGLFDMVLSVELKVKAVSSHQDALDCFASLAKAKVELDYFASQRRG
jgi:hypothetical protein